MANIVRNNRQKTGNPILDFWNKNSHNILPPLMGFLGFLIVWQLVSMVGLIKLPPPSDIITNQRTRIYLMYPWFDRGGLDKGLFWQTLESLKRVLIGYSMAAIVGIGTGILIGLNPFLNKALDPLFQFLRTVPPLAWVPLSLAALQQNQPAALFVIFITAVWPILINTTVGVQQIPQDYINVRQVLQLSPQKFFFKILIPSALPYIFTGLRIAIGLAWLAIIAAEIVMSGIVGIGFFIWDAYQNNYISDIILALVYIGAVGLMLDRFMAWLQTVIAPGE
ncbi:MULTISPECIES: nitrate ABC transporter permease [Planktothricoides]|uniref:Nitrate ABC transporter permease n=2 Tax=Planktothricoides raciborskii TaxID=132608 RepID=A0AAU8JF44_9CYAN|nr:MULTISPECIES: nitrate ABC transporter permease [Planktothricoides]KOR35473.1 bicarbonate transporter permease [Planktothricoides sp. SR001]MBD2545175.1 nitrate ABC transporter permease [Planktothricoides raciborskii FACHB-1370]MBD2583296.1 nitrate ABC transporter permease [Planktothricoides raciborskii FACHB-1261]